MKNKLPAVLFLFLAVSFVFVGFQNGGSTLSGGIVLAILFAFLGIRRWSRSGSIKTKSTEARQTDAKPSPQQASMTKNKPVGQMPAFDYLTFKVKGVTFKNEDESDRQTILRHMKFHDAPYVSGDSVEVSITPYLFKGEKALGCYLNGYMVGSVSRDMIDRVSAMIEREGAEVSAFDIYGGGKNEDGSPRSYGCEITIRCPTTF